MKTNFFSLHVLAAAASMLVAASAPAQSSSFTYQGVLHENGAPANGPHDFVFVAYNAPSGGLLVGTTTILPDVVVSNGLFSAQVDMGGGVFTGGNRWLEVRVRPAGGSVFTSLSPRQPVTAAPYAIHAANFTGPIAPGQIAPGSITGAMIAAGAVGAAQLAPGTVGPTELAKPYQAGSISYSSFGSLFQQFNARRLDRSVTFPVPFATTPSVTLTLDTPHLALASKGPLLVKSKSTTGFTASLPVGPVGVEIMRSAGTFDPILRVIGGQPAMTAVAIVNSTIGLAYSHALDVTGNSWAAPVILATGYLGIHDLTEVDGRPAVVFANASGGVSFVRANDAAGDSWPTPVQIYAPDAGAFINPLALALVNGAPALAIGQSDLTVRFQRASDPQGTLWTAAEKAFTGLSALSSLALREVTGRPAVAVLDSGTRTVLYARANDAVGTGWPAPTTAVSNPNPGSPWDGPHGELSFIEVGGWPAIGYVATQGINYPDKRVMFARAIDSNGAAWGSSQAITAFEPVLSLKTSFAAIGASPGLTISAASRLRYGGSFDAGGTYVFTTPYDVEACEGRASLAVVQGQPAIAFVSDSAVRYIRSNNAPPNSAVNWIAVAP